MSARAKKRLCGGRPRSEDHRHTTFFRLSRRHPPLPRCLSFHSLMQLSGSYKKRCPRAFPISGPTAVNRPRHGKGTRAYSRLTEVNPYSAPVIRGAHVPCLPKKSFFLMFPLCKWGAIGKNDNRYPLALCCLYGTCRACTTKNGYPLAP